MKKKMLFAALSAVLLFTGCASHYHVAQVSRERILIDQRWDATPDAEAAQWLSPYKHRVDSIMSPVVGRVTHYMSAHRPESDLSNLLADILLWAGKDYGEHPDLAVYNMGGIRAALAEGDVTYGDVLDVAPFENKICFLTLSGEKLLQLYREMAATGGEGVSHGVKIVIGQDGSMKSGTLNGQPIDPNGSYRVATLDYLAQGNDHLEAFKAKTDVVSPQTESNNVRYIICHYFHEQMAQGKTVDARTEGRITRE
jgi:2',3'-cyclic-nucleotide 2'-phosphodiesterase (5'-nucleotidase family)